MPSDCLSGINILVAEDQDDSRYLMTFTLESHGATVKSYQSAPEALAAIDTFLPHVIVSDINLLDHDGYWFIRRVRQRGGRVPALAVTSLSAPEDRRKALEAGFQIFITKPFDFDLLVGVIRTLVDLTDTQEVVHSDPV
jgi:CheY-like chemotaxis protein